MKVRIVLVAVVASLALVGCAGGDDPTPAQPVPAETARESVGETPSPDATPTPTLTPDSPYGSSEKNARGNIPKAIGQLAGFSNAAGDVMADFTVTAIQVDFPCTSEYAEPPVNGHFVAVTFDITTGAALAQEDYPQVSFTEYEMKVFSADGTRENDPVGTGYSCLAEAEKLPPSMGAGEHSVGKIVLDTANTSGSIVYAAGGNPSGWEWGF